MHKYDIDDKVIAIDPVNYDFRYNKIVKIIETKDGYCYILNDSYAEYKESCVMFPCESDKLFNLLEEYYKKYKDGEDDEDE